MAEKTLYGRLLTNPSKTMGRYIAAQPKFGGALGADPPLAVQLTLDEYREVLELARKTEEGITAQ